MRALAKEIRLQEQSAKAAKREEAKHALQAEQQLKRDLKESKKGKKKALKAPPQVT